VSLIEFQRLLGVKFKNLSLLNTALTHRSYANEWSDGNSNERLEFLGDSVLGLIISDHLMSLYPSAQEGDLTQLRSNIVSKYSLMETAKRLSLGMYLLVSPSEDNSGGRNKAAILADTMEAVVGAYYVDRGYKKTYWALIRWFDAAIQKVKDGSHAKDYKSMLQDFVQQTLQKTPTYAMVKRSGPIHEHFFRVKVKIGSTVYGEGTGMTKKLAEQTAAGIAYAKITKENIKK